MVIVDSYARRRVQSLREQIKNDPPAGLKPIDQEAILMFDEELQQDRNKRNRCGWAHHASLLNDLLLIATETQLLAATLQDGQAAEDAVNEITSWITEEDLDAELSKSEYTVQSQLSALRNFAATLLDIDFDNLPERFDEIEPASHVTEDPAPLPAEVLRWEDVVEMVKEMDSLRDIALLLVQWDMGMRPQKELYTLQKKNIEFHDQTAEITLPNKHGKTDERKLLITVGWTVLQKWVEEEHPAQNDPEESMTSETFIWTKHKENKHLAYGSMAARFEVAGERAGIDKKHSAQHFRRSSASIFAGKSSITERDLRYMYSWSRKGHAPEHYIQRFSDATQKNIARARGLEIEDTDLNEDPDVTAIVCANCKEWTERALSNCVWCDHNVDEKQATINTSRTIENPVTMGEKSVKELIFDGDLTPEQIRLLLKVKPHIRSDPEFFGKLEEALPKAEALHDTDSDIIGATSPVGIAGYASATAARVTKGYGVAKHIALRIHPDFDGYPPSPARTAGILAGVGVIVTTAVAISVASGLTNVLTNPLALATLLVSLLVGTWLVDRDIPTIDEAVESAAD
jgi:site-specific recombinase XerD